MRLLTATTLLLATAAAAAPDITRRTVAGIDLVACKTPVAGVVTFRGSLPAGERLSPGAPLVASLTAAMLDRGTLRHDKFALAAKLEAVGASIRFSAGENLLSISGKCLRKDLPLVIALLAEQLRHPAFDPAELDRLKKQTAGRLRRARESTATLASIAFARALYPPDHPNYALTLDERLAALESATPENLRAFHAATYGPARCALVFAGDLDPDEIRAEIEKNFAGWTGGQPLPPPPPVPPRQPAAGQAAVPPRVENIPLADKPNITVLIGQRSRLRATDPAAIPLRAATAILGSGFTGRLMATVRDKEGLTYGIRAAASNDTFADGDWLVSANFAPELLRQGLASTFREINAWLENGVTQAELDRVKTNLAGAYEVGLSTTAGLASALLDCLHKNRPLSWLDEYPRRLAALRLDEVNAALRLLDVSEMVQIRCGSLPPE